MNLNAIKHALIKHGPSILTGVAMVGVAVTGYLVHRADRKIIGDVAESILFEEDTEKPIGDTVKVISKKNWKNYLTQIFLLTTRIHFTGTKKIYLKEKEN